MARLRSGRGTNATVHSPYASPKTMAAAAPLSCGGQPSESSRCGSKSRTLAADAASSTSNRESRDQGESITLVHRAVRPVGVETASSAARESSVAGAAGTAVAVPPERVVASSIRRQ